MAKWIAAALFVATSAFAQENPTAYQALRDVGRQFGRESVNKVISITGVNGNPQPDAWRIMLADVNAPGGVREVVVRNGQISSNRGAAGTVVGTTKGATVDVTKLNLDSSGAYAVASHTAENSHTVFDRASYTLRTDDRGYPTWIVTLQYGSQPVGTIHIGAYRGTITRTEGMFRGTNMKDVVQTNPREDEGGQYAGGEVTMSSGGGEGGHYEGEENDNPIKRMIKRTFKSAFYRAREESRATFQHWRRNFADTIRGD